MKTKEVREKKRKWYVPVAAVAIAAVAVMGVMTLAGAQEVDGQDGSFGFGPGGRPENHQAVKDALDSCDYEAWQEAIADLPMADELNEKINADNFGRLCEAHGHLEEARAIFEELDLKPPFGGHHGPRMSAEEREAVEAAIEARDYNAWSEAIGDKPIVEKITAENFERFCEAHDLMESGQTEEAKAIFDELGVKPPMGPHFGER